MTGIIVGLILISSWTSASEPPPPETKESARARPMANPMMTYGAALNANS
jgi:hypothetical protein